MPGAKKHFIGLEGFIWWIGVVEDRNDPEQLGRVRVRCFGWHTDDKSLIPTDSLPWAHPAMPINAPNVYTPKEGDMVFGFFIDGENAQNPAIVGILPGKPESKPKYEKGFSDPGTDLSGRPKKPDDDSEKYPKSKYLKEPTLNRLSRGKSDATIIATRKKNLKKNVKSAGGVRWSEPPPSFAPKYPYNNALETESGHALEFDDTPGKERVHLAHRTGAYIEFDKDGTRIQRVQKDNYAVIMGDDFIYIKGKASITVDGNFNLKTSTINIEASEINMAADGAVKIKGSSVKIESTGGMDLKAGGAGKFTAGSRLDLKGATAGLGGATVDIPAGKVNIQGGSVSSASGTGLKGGGTSATAEEQQENANTAEVATSTTANTAASANSVGTAASTSSAAAGIDPKAAPVDPLEPVQITSKKVEVPKGQSMLGKVVGGITSTVNKVADTLVQTADSISKDFRDRLPLGEIAGKVEGFAVAINTTKSEILALAQDPKQILLNKIDNVSLLSYENNLDFKIDKDIQNEMLNSIYNVSDAQLNSVIGKHIYPKTETVQMENDQLYAEYEEVLIRFAAQEIDPEEGNV
jgi:hypothetical protein